VYLVVPIWPYRDLDARP